MSKLVTSELFETATPPGVNFFDIWTNAAACVACPDCSFCGLFHLRRMSRYSCQIKTMTKMSNTVSRISPIPCV